MADGVSPICRRYIVAMRSSISGNEAEAVISLGQHHHKFRRRDDLSDGADVPQAPKAPKRESGKGLRLVSYRPLFSGPAVERIPELQFQRPGSEIELSAADAAKIGAGAGSTVKVSSNGTSIELRARVNKNLVRGVARIPVEHAQGLGTHVEVST